MERKTRPGSTLLIIGVALLLWVVGWIALPSLDPGPRSDWGRQPPTRESIDPDVDGRISFSRRDRSFERPWCPLCRFVEENVAPNRWLSQLAGVVQLIALATVVAGAWSLFGGGSASRSSKRRGANHRRR